MFVLCLSFHQLYRPDLYCEFFACLGLPSPPLYGQFTFIGCRLVSSRAQRNSVLCAGGELVCCRKLLFGGMSKTGVTYTGFSWHSGVTDHIHKGQMLFAEQRHARQTAIAWDKSQVLPDGQFLTWKRPATYQAGYVWFYRQLVKLSKADKEACSWFVVGHPTQYDPALVAEARVLATAGEVPDQPLAVPYSESPDKIMPQVDSGERQDSPMTRYAGQVLCPEATAGTDGDGSDDSTTAFLYRDPCVALSISRRPQLLAANGSHYEMREALGEGSFGRIFLAKRGTIHVAVKKMKKDGWADAFDEAYVVERCREHPHIIQLLDAFSTVAAGKVRAHLVYERWGTDLGAHVALVGALPPQDLRTALAQVCSALHFLHRKVGMIHTDVKTSNVLVVRRKEATGQALRCKLADFGSCVEALWAHTSGPCFATARNK